VLYPYPGTFPLNLGIEAGLDYSLFSQGVGHSPIDNPTSPNRTLTSGNGIGGFFVVQAELPIGKSMGLQARAGYQMQRIISSGQGIADCPQNSENQFDTVTMGVRRTMKTSDITAGLFFRADIARNLFVTIGPVAHFWLRDLTVTDRLEILSPGSCLFSSTGQKTAEVTATDDQTLNRTRYGLEGGIGYRIPIGSNLRLTPALRFQYMITPLAPDGGVGVDTFRERTLGDLNLSLTDRMLHAIQLGIGLWWHP
jgi:hypothetical protein